MKEYLQNLIMRYWHTHWHVMRVENMATSKLCGEYETITAWRLRCLLCGMEINEVTPSGLDQIAQGHPVDLVISWMDGKR